MAVYAPSYITRRFRRMIDGPALFNLRGKLIAPIRRGGIFVIGIPKLRSIAPIAWGMRKLSSKLRRLIDGRVIKTTRMTGILKTVHDY